MVQFEIFESQKRNNFLILLNLFDRLCYLLINLLINQADAARFKTKISLKHTLQNLYGHSLAVH